MRQMQLRPSWSDSLCSGCVSVFRGCGTIASSASALPRGDYPRRDQKHRTDWSGHGWGEDVRAGRGLERVQGWMTVPDCRTAYFHQGDAGVGKVGACGPQHVRCTSGRKHIGGIGPRRGKPGCWAMRHPGSGTSPMNTFMIAGGWWTGIMAASIWVTPLNRCTAKTTHLSNSVLIGSGMAESGAKQFKDRLTGPGIWWSRPGAERLLPIRAAVISQTFEDA